MIDQRINRFRASRAGCLGPRVEDEKGRSQFGRSQWSQQAGDAGGDRRVSSL